MARSTVSLAQPMPRATLARPFFPECCRSARPAAA